MEDHTSILENSQIWIVMSFLLFIVLTYKVGKTAIYKMLDKKIKAIKDEIDTAESIRTQAQELLAQYQRKQKDAVMEAENIIKNAEAHAVQLKKISEQELEESIKRKEEQLIQRIELMKKQAKIDIKNHIIDVSIEATKQTISNNLKSDKKIIEQTINSLEDNIKNAA